MSYSSTRIGYTAPNPYDQIFVLSQRLINDAFAFLHDHADESTPMIHFYKKIREEYIDMYLGASTIQLQAIGIDPQLYFMINVSSGTLAVWPDDESEETKKYPMDGWVLAYPVKLSSAVIPANDPLYSKKGIDPSVFSLTQLYLTSSSSTTLNEDLSSYGNSGIKSNPYAYASFKTFLSKWLETMQAENQTILGYGKTVTPEGADDTTYPPTSLDYYIYPWKGETSGEPIKNNLDNNCLSYLMMSDWRPAPAPIGIPYSGPFTNGTAAYCMNTTTFWDTWLLPILKQYNSGSEVVPTTSTPYYKAPYWYCPLTFQVGGNPDHGPTESYYNFSKSGSSWSWQGRTLYSQGSGSSGGNIVTDYETSTSSTTLSFEQGGNTISVAGVNVFTFSQSYNNESNPSKITYTTNWRLKLKINSVKDGGIQMVNDPSAQTADTTFVVNHVGNLYFVNPDSAKASFSNRLRSSLTSATTSVHNAVVNTLDNQNKLVLPAAGTFDMINPLFNNRGDLLVDLWYDGTHDTDPGGGGGKSLGLAERFMRRPDVYKSLLSTFEDEAVRNGGPEKVLEILSNRPKRIGKLEEIPYTPEPITVDLHAEVRT